MEKITGLTPAKQRKVDVYTPNYNTVSTKETLRKYNFVMIVDGKIERVASVEILAAKSRNVIYAEVHVFGQHGAPDIHAIGKAGGGGYDRESAAVEDAFNNAGYELSTHIAGRGMYEAERVIISDLAELTGNTTIKMFG